MTVYICKHVTHSRHIIYVIVYDQKTCSGAVVATRSQQEILFSLYYSLESKSKELQSVNSRHKEDKTTLEQRLLAKERELVHQKEMLEKEKQVHHCT